MKKRIAAIGIVLALLAVLAGCTREEQAGRPQITWYLRAEDESLYNELKGIAAIEDATGVDVNFICPPNDSEDAFKMMVASGKLPDVIMWQHSSAIDRMYQEGTILDLTDLIAQHAPTLTALYERRPELRRQVETAGGRIYYFPSINPMETIEEIGRKSYCGLIIRDDWLSKLGLSAPNTIDEWYEVLTAFKTRDPNGNGFQDEIPFDGWGLPYFLPAFGVLDNFCINAQGEVVFGPMEMEYKAYLETMHKWYEEGLLGSNCFIHSDPWKTENIVNDLTGAFAGLDNAWRYYLPTLQENTSEAASLQAVPWLRAENGTRYTPREDVASNMATIVTVITSACENPEAAVKLIDYMYSEKGSELLTWGIEGESFEWVDGERRLTELALTTDPEKGWLRLYEYAVGHAAFPKYDGETVVLASYPEEQLIAERTWADASTALVYPPGIALDVEDKAFCDGVMDDVQPYLTEMELKFITGEEPLSSFDLFAAQLERMGVGEALEIYRQAYAAYQQKQ